MPESGRRRLETSMVDVGAKATTERVALAEAVLSASEETIQAILRGRIGKGDVLAAAELAGIQAAKRTAELIPLCHHIPLDWVRVNASVLEDPPEIRIECTVRATAKTGVEMEALVGAAVAALSAYDMCKAMGREMTIEHVRLLEKRGGTSGDFLRNARG